MLRFALRRFLEAIPVVVGVSLVVFLFLRLVPGDPAVALLGERATPEALARVREQRGLNQPWAVQYWRYVQGLARGDWGRSIQTNAPVLQEARARFPATVELTVAALVLASVGGVGAGILSAAWRGSIVDHAARVLSLTGVSMPIFWLGLVLIWIFAVQLRWLPSDGRLDADTRYTPITSFVLLDAVLQRRPELAANALRHLILPAAALSTVPMAIIARMTRGALLEVLHTDYVRAARAKGLGERAVTLRHALKNAAIPVVTVIGLQVGVLLSGAVLTETIFAWPGIGRWIFESIGKRDYPVVQGMSLIVAGIFILVNLAVDLFYAALDPRIRVHGH
ncbi:MAG TPA: ABC transporter permease [Chloroflexota bacterium]|jgi:peptide/nickel transport system permease protein|nr:ABC transporter permease [Chloroflexota bacterium]